MDLLQSAIKAYKDASFFLTIYDILYNIHIIRSNRLDTVCCRLHKFNWKEIMYRSDWPLRQWLQTPSVAICRTCLSSCTLAMLASSNSKCLCFSQRCLKRHPIGIDCTHIHTYSYVYLLYINNKCTHIVYVPCAASFCWVVSAISCYMILYPISSFWTISINRHLGGRQ